jgi:hypothetical protein
VCTIFSLAGTKKGDNAFEAPAPFKEKVLLGRVSVNS